MVKSFPPEWIKNRERLTNRLRAEIDWILGEKDDDLQRYESEFFSELPKDWKTQSLADFFEFAARGTGLLIGDYHTFVESQRMARRVLSKILRLLGPQGRSVTVFLESVDFQQQFALDRFLAEQGFGVHQFLQAIHFDERWGPQWEGYCDLLSFIKDQGLDARAIGFAGTLPHRDEQMARAIFDYRRNQATGGFAVVHVGEWHCSRGHLPLAIKRLEPEVRLATLIMCPDSIFFEQARRGAVDSASILQGQAESAFFCSFAAPPWVRLHSLLETLTHSDDLYLDDDDWDDSTFEERAQNLIDMFCHELKLSVANTPKVSLLGEGFEDEWMDHPTLGWMFKKFRSVYIPQESRLILARPSWNELAGQLAYHYWNHYGGCRQTLELSSPELERWVWGQMFVFFFARWMNPALKVKTQNDFEKLLPLTKESEKIEALQYCIAWKTQNLSSLRTRGQAMGLRGAELSRGGLFLAAKYLGNLMGEQLYFAYRSGEVDVDLLEEFLIFDVFSEAFLEYFAAVESSLSSVVIPYSSSEERV